MTDRLEIRLLGGLEIYYAGTLLDTFMSNKAPALLTYLALNPRMQQRDLLAALLWGEMSDADAKNNLRQVLANLRKLLDPYLIVTRESIGFNRTSSYFIDVETFDLHLKQSRQLSNAQTTSQMGGQLSSEQIAQLQAAVALYQGDFLAGFAVREAPEYEEWLLAQRARLRELALHTLHQLSEWQLAHAQYSQVIASASQSLSIDPWREEAHRHLMNALARSGQRSAALAQYRQCQRILHDELGVEPSAETRLLFERLRSAGEEIAHNLPIQPTSFIGRNEELQNLENLLLQTDCRLLTLVGVGGTGKTRLALALAERLHQSGVFLNGVYFIPLAALESADLLVSAIAEACGLNFFGNKDPKTQLLDFLRGQELLLLLDNFEQIVDAASWLGELLQRAPRLKLLITSRVRLNTRWEHLVMVGGLSAEQATQLFEERARQVDPDFAGDGSVNDICQLAQGLPLAIELAAAHVRHYSCLQIAESLATTLDLLTSQLRDIPERHRSLRAVFDYSWQKLSPEEQHMLLLLSVFQGTFHHKAVQAIYPDWVQIGDIRGKSYSQLLSSLIDKSLLQRNTNGRLQLHELIRQYAAGKLAQRLSWQETALRIHASYYADIVACQASAISGRDQRQSLLAIEEELDNVRVAWNWTTQNCSQPQLESMVEPLFEFYEVRSLVQEAVERFGQALQMIDNSATAPSAPLLLIKLLNRQARFLTRLGKRLEADLLLQRSSKLAEENGLEGELGLALNYRGLVMQVNGDYQTAVTLFRQSVTGCERVADQNGIARALNNLGVIHLRMGKLSEAEQYLQSALQLRRQLGNPKLVADSLNNLGILLHESAEYSREAELLGEALANYRQLNDHRGIGVTLHNLGGVHLALQEFEQARYYLEEALFYRQADPAGLGNTLNNLGVVAQGAGDIATAAHYFRQALQLTFDNQDLPMMLDVLVGMADWLLRKGQTEVALEILTAIIPHAQDSDTQSESQRLLALACTTCGESAYIAANEAHKPLEKIVILALHSVVA